tara:strand:- start:621 stop:935 length:315 start_codon:yes stop_codon:yes gene_type:complete
MAIKLRASEKQILGFTITAIEEELLKLPQGSNMDGSITPAGRSFDTLRTKANVVDAVNSRNMGAWVDIKGEKVERKDGGVGDNSKTAEPQAESIAERRRKRRGR